MRPLQQLAALFLAATALISCQSQTEPPEIIVLGRMVTMDPQQPQVSAVAINNGRFSFVGDQTSALALRGPHTRVIDLGGSFNSKKVSIRIENGIIFISLIYFS